MSKEYEDYESGTVLLCLANDGLLADKKSKKIKKKCNELDLKCTRVKDLLGSDKITEVIHNEIEKSEFIIFDITYSKPNIYYEIGYARGVGNESDAILIIAEKDAPIHFNIGELKVHYYNSIKELGDIVEKNLKYLMKG